MKSWKTTLVGWVLIGVGIYEFITTKQWQQPALCIATGIGLICAKDSNK